MRKPGLRSLGVRLNHMKLPIFCLAYGNFRWFRLIPFPGTQNSRFWNEVSKATLPGPQALNLSSTVHTSTQWHWREEKTCHGGILHQTGPTSHHEGGGTMGEGMTRSFSKQGWGLGIEQNQSFEYTGNLYVCFVAWNMSTLNTLYL